MTIDLLAPIAGDAPPIRRLPARTRAALVAWVARYVAPWLSAKRAADRADYAQRRHLMGENYVPEQVRRFDRATSGETKEERTRRLAAERKRRERARAGIKPRVWMAELTEAERLERQREQARVRAARRRAIQRGEAVDGFGRFA